MTLRRNRGKLRSEPARRGELHVVPAPAVDAGDGRTPEGKFAPGNKASSAKGWTSTLAKLLGGKGIPSEAMQQVGRDAWRMNGSVLRELPATSAIVRANVALLSMHSATAGYYSASALASGLDTPEGQKASERARVHGQRVSQLSVVVLDLSSKLAAAERPDASVALAAGWARLQAERAREVEPEAGARPERSSPAGAAPAAAAPEPVDVEPEGARVLCDDPACNAELLLSDAACWRCGRRYDGAAEPAGDELLGVLRGAGREAVELVAARPEPEAPAPAPAPGDEPPFCARCGTPFRVGVPCCVRCGRPVPVAVQAAQATSAAGMQAALAEAARRGPMAT